MHGISPWKEKLDYVSWAMSVFCNKHDFEVYHKMVGKEYDYSEMRKKIITHASKATKTNGRGLNPDFYFIDSVCDVIDGVSSLFNS
jgi:hypothetical protein